MPPGSGGSGGVSRERHGEGLFKMSFTEGGAPLHADEGRTRGWRGDHSDTGVAGAKQQSSPQWVACSGSSGGGTHSN